MSMFHTVLRCTIGGGVALAFLTLFAAVAVGRQQAPPAPAAPRPVRIPKPFEKTLSNGLRVIVIEKRNMPLITAEVVIKSGAEADLRDKSGLADLSAELLTKGTDTRTAPEIARAIESLGGELGSSASWDASMVHVSVLSSNIPAAMEVLADVVIHPAFKGEEIERLRQQFLDDLKVELREPSSVARFAAARAVFGESPYGHPVSGTPESVRSIRQKDVMQFHEKYYRPDNAILFLCGDIGSDGAFDLVEKYFGVWPKPAQPLRKDAGEAVVRTKPRVVVIDMPEAGQAAVVVARPALRRTDAEYFSALVANSVLGGGYSSRLNQEIRVKRGLSYGAGSSVEARRSTGLFRASVQTKNESAAEVASLMVKELDRLETEPVPESELTPRKAVLIGGFGRSLETTGGLVGQAAALALYDLSLDGINSYIERVGGVTASDVKNCTHTKLSRKDASIVIVGNAKVFLEGLRKEFGEVERIPLSKLDLNRSTLVKPVRSPKPKVQNPQ
jgi:zinc protease